MQHDYQSLRRGSSRFGNKDLTSLIPFSSMVNQYVAGLIQEEQARLERARRKAEEDVIISELANLQRLRQNPRAVGLSQSTQSLPSLEEIGARLIAGGGHRGAMIADYIARTQPRLDQNLSTTELALRAAAGDAVAAKAWELMNKKPEDKARYVYRPRLDDKGRPVTQDIGDVKLLIEDEIDTATGKPTGHFRYGMNVARGQDLNIWAAREAEELREKYMEEYTKAIEEANLWEISYGKGNLDQIRKEFMKHDKYAQLIHAPQSLREELLKQLDPATATRFRILLKYDDARWRAEAARKNLSRFDYEPDPDYPGQFRKMIRKPTKKTSKGGRYEYEEIR